MPLIRVLIYWESVVICNNCNHDFETIEKAAINGK
jgi:hypothetical protein